MVQMEPKLPYRPRTGINRQVVPRVPAHAAMGRTSWQSQASRRNPAGQHPETANKSTEKSTVKCALPRHQPKQNGRKLSFQKVPPHLRMGPGVGVNKLSCKAASNP